MDREADKLETPGRPVRRFMVSRGAAVFRRLSSRELPPLVSDEYAGTSLSRYRAKEWSLVLTARSVPHSLRRFGTGWTIQVPRRRADEAALEITAFLNENREEALIPPAPRAPSNAAAVLWTLGVVAVCLAYLGSDSWIFGQRIRWDRLGGGDSAAMLSGKWWLAATALTLHADPPHLIGNLVTGCVFLLLLCRETGVGVGFFLCLAAGICGNWLKVELQGPGVYFIGSSTAVFGALGALGGLRSVRGFSGMSWKRALPAGAGLMLLAMLGSGEENDRIDLVGHVCGFAAGLVLGALAGAILSERKRPGAGTGGALGLAAILVVLSSWGAALFGTYG